MTPADWTSAGLTLTLGSDGNLHVYTTGTTTDAVPPCAPASVANIEITSPSSTTANLTIDSTNGDPIPAGGLDYSGAGGLIITGSGTVTLSGTNSYTGGTTVSAGTLLITNASALPGGTSLTVGAGGTFVFDPSQAAAPIVARNDLATASVTTPAISSLSPSRPVTPNSPVVTPMDFAASAGGVAVQQATAFTAASSKHSRTDLSAGSAPMSSGASEVVFKSYRSPVDRTISRADNAQSAHPWAWLTTIESSWNSADENKTTESKVAALEKVLARFGV